MPNEALESKDILIPASFDRVGKSLSKKMPVLLESLLKKRVAA
jgi:hypothetical protein